MGRTVKSLSAQPPNAEAVTFKLIDGRKEEKMCNLDFRALRADEVECRIGTFKEGKGLTLLLYKDARCDQIILDETVGCLNWQKSYDLIDGQLFCTISVWDEDKKMWISKQDVGVESNTEAEKGRASDAQKRAAFAFGIGRELYTAPFIWVGTDGFKTKYDKFSVTDMAVEDGKITKLRITNDTLRKEVYTYGCKENKSESAPKTAKSPRSEVLVDDVQVELIRAELSRTGVSEKSLLQHYDKITLVTLNIDEYADVMEKLKKYPTKGDRK